jgi:hypothetical protein
LGEALEDLKAVVERNSKLFSELQKLKISISNLSELPEKLKECTKVLE